MVFVSENICVCELVSTRCLVFGMKFERNLKSASTDEARPKCCFGRLLCKFCEETRCVFLVEVNVGFRPNFERPATESASYYLSLAHNPLTQ